MLTILHKDVVINGDYDTAAQYQNPSEFVSVFSLLN